MKFSDKTYDVLKWICLIALPALCTLLGTVLPSFGVADGDVSTVVTVISAVSAFIGALIGISTTTYYKGEE